MKMSDHYTDEDILLAMFIMTAPTEVRSRIVQVVREQVSIKAGSAIERLMAATFEAYPNVTFMFADMREHLPPELQGPALPKKELTGEIAKLAAALGVRDLLPPCDDPDCPRCTAGREAAKTN